MRSSQERSQSKCRSSKLARTAAHQDRSKLERLLPALGGVYQGWAALPSARSLRMRLPISTAVTAASPPLLPTLPPARSMACAARGSEHVSGRCQRSGSAAQSSTWWGSQQLPAHQASGLQPAGCFHQPGASHCARAAACSVPCDRAGQGAGEERPHLLHCVAGQHSKHDGHPRVGGRVEHARGGAAHHRVIVRGGTAHLHGPGWKAGHPTASRSGGGEHLMEPGKGRVQPGAQPGGAEPL